MYIASLQELKTFAECADTLPLLGSFLHHLATCFGGFSSYCDLYHSDHPSLLTPSSLGSTGECGGEEERMECGEEEEEEGEEDTPPNLMSHLHLMLTGVDVRGCSAECII